MDSPPWDACGPRVGELRALQARRLWALRGRPLGTCGGGAVSGLWASLPSRAFRFGPLPFFLWAQWGWGAFTPLEPAHSTPPRVALGGSTG